jgi:Protein of unknown function (DUF2752)
MADLPADSTPAVRAWLPTAPISTACGLVAATAYVAAVDPAERGVFPPCPFRSVTGWWCPGCGLTRATHHLLHGDMLGALRYNALTPLVLTLIAVLWLDWYARSIGKRPMLRRIPGWATAAGILVAVTFAVLRNLPGVDGLRG